MVSVFVEMLRLHDVPLGSVEILPVEERLKMKMALLEMLRLEMSA